MQILNLEPRHLKSRDCLLQTALRPDNPEYSITKEYPVLLARDAVHSSYGFVAEDNVIAHVQYWPRQLVLEEQRLAVALVGNVASDVRYRGQGLIRRLIGHLHELAQAEGKHGLFLWSDMLPFYQKLGFRPFGQELRISVKSEQVAARKATQSWRHIRACDLGEHDIARLLGARYPAQASLNRSIEEFQKLLKIPDTVLLCDDVTKAKPNFVILGKGYDLIGVIHEWGMDSPELMLDCIRHVIQLTSWPFVVILAPSYLDSGFLAGISGEVQRHHLALYLPVGQGLSPEVEAKCFFWGLDSI